MKKKIKNKVKESNFGLSLVLKYHRFREQKLSVLSDEEFAQRVYDKAGLGSLNLKHPKTFDEKLWWLKINYRDSLMTDCTDKIKVRDFVKSKGLNHILNEIYGIYTSFEEINFKKLPKEFYLKTNQSSATNMYIKNVDNMNISDIKKRMELYLKKNHYSLSREWNYKDIEPKIFAEKVIKSRHGLIDFRFFCSYGKVKGLTVDIDTADEKGEHSTEAKRNVYDENFNLMDVRLTRPRFDNSTFSMPENINEMKRYAEILSETFPFCRVDLYNVEGNILFGELTFFHQGGINRISPLSYQLTLGEWIELPKKY